MEQASLLSRCRAFAGNVLLLLVSLSIVILFLEWALRALDVQQTVDQGPNIYRVSENPIVSYELIPGIREREYAKMATVNDLGFRSAPYDPEKPLFALIGDSITFGWGLQDHETIGANLQELLPCYTVQSGGVAGYNLAQEIEQLKTKFLPLKPEIIFEMFVFNDFEPTMALDDEGYFYGPSEGKPTEPYLVRLQKSITKDGTYDFPLKLWLQQNSAVFTFLERITKDTFIRTQAKKPGIFTETIARENIQVLDAALKEVADVTPKETVRMFGIWPADFLHQNVRPDIFLTARRHGFHVIDFYGVYGNYYSNLAWDGHPDGKANKRTAQVIVEYLKEKGLLKFQHADGTCAPRS